MDACTDGYEYGCNYRVRAEKAEATIERERMEFMKREHALMLEVERLESEARRWMLEEKRCECSADDACQFARQRDSLQAEVERLRAAISVCVREELQLDCPENVINGDEDAVEWFVAKAQEFEDIAYLASVVSEGAKAKRGEESK